MKNKSDDRHTVLLIGKPYGYHPVMHTILTDGSATFTPAQAGRLTGIDPDKQRNWRSRDILPKGDPTGWTRFNVWGLLSLAFIAEASAAGVDLSTARDMAGKALKPMATFLNGDGSGDRYVALLSHDAASETVVVSSLAALDGYDANGFWAEHSPTALRIFDTHAVVRRLVGRIERLVHVAPEER